VINFGASLGDPAVDRLLTNLWTRLTVP
jgi:hypothetical protein